MSNERNAIIVMDENKSNQHEIIPKDIRTHIKTGKLFITILLVEIFFWMSLTKFHFAPVERVYLSYNSIDRDSLFH